MKSSNLYAFPLTLCFLFLSPILLAQVTVNGVSPFEQYVLDLQGPGINITNITINCDTVQPQMGGFDGTAANFGLDSGLVMTSGSINSAVPGGITATSLFTPGDPQLDAINTNFTNDACVVTFDLEPACDTVRFRYVFGSHEYPTFVGSAFNDIFACFISGPGYAPNTNIALLPVVNQNVSVNTVNGGTNAIFYVDNGLGLSQIGYSGHTVVLEAIAVVNPCQIYNVKLAIADATDNTLDSGVFIEAFTCGENLPSVAAGNLNNPDNPVAVEECVDGVFTFVNPGDTTQPAIINFTLGGTATLGVDYFFPSTVAIPAGQSTLSVPVTIFADNLAEGPETVILTLDTLNCFGGSATLTIQDPFKADAGPDLTLCSGQQATVGATSVPDVAYNWQAAFGLQPPYNIAQPTVGLSTLSTLSYNYLLTTTDLLNGCVDSDTVNVTYVPLPKANFTMASDICVDATTTITFSQIQVPGLVYNWDFDNPSLVNGSGAGPYVVSWNTPGIKTVTLFVEDQGCLSPVITKTITVHPIPTSTFLATATVCANQSSQVTYTGSASPNAIFTWDFDGGTGGTGTGPFNVQWNTPGTKTISLMVEEFGCVSNTTIQQVVVNEVPTADFNAQSSVCEGDQSVITYTGTATANAGYAWDFDGGTIISGTAGGPYTVSWPFAGAKTVCLQVQENGCISSLVCETVNVQATPVAGIAPVSNQCFNGNSFDFVYTGDANVTSYAWLFGADATPAISTSATPPSVSYLNPGIKTVALVVTRNGCVSDTAFATFEVVEDPVSDFSASTTGACFEECITYNFTGYSPGIQMTYLWDFGQDATPASSSQPAPPCVDYNSSGTKTVTLTVNFKGCVDQSVQTVTIHPGPIVNGGGDVAFCDGEGGAQIDASVTGGTTPYYYSWWCQDPTGAACGLSGNFIEDPIVNPIVTPNAPDSMVYYFQVTDFNGCTSNIDSVTAIVKAKPKMDAGPDVAICKEGPGAFLQGGVSSDNRAPLPIDYQWLPATGLNNPNVPNPFARPAETTIYTLLGTSVNGCASEVTTLDTLSTVTVHVNDLPVAEAGADTAICLNDSVQLAGSASMAGPNYSYTWTPAIAGTIDDPNSPSPFVKPSFTTTYYLVVTSNGCDSYADSVEVIVDTKPTLSPGSDESICQGDSVKLNGLASGDPFGSQYSYEWTPTVGLSDPGQGDPLAGPKQTTTYTVVATSEHGCGSDAKSILVTVESTPIVFILKPDTVVCEGDEINLFADHGFKTPSATPVVYDWQPQDGSIISSPFVKSIQIVPATTTIYSVTATAPSGCATTDEVLVTVNPRVEATLSADTTQFCEGLATRLYAAGGLGNAEVQWLPSTGLDDSTSFNPFASPSENTTYQVVITEGACSDTAAVSLTINPAPIPDYFASQDAGCAGLEVSFMENATNGTNFLWDFGDGSPVNNEVNPSHVYAEPGSYPVTLTAVGPGGCEADITKTVVEVSDGAFADFSSSPEAMNEIPLPGATVQFTDLSANGVSWYWDFGDGNVSTAQNPTHTYAQAGEYGVSLTVTDGNGCTSTIQYGPYIIFNPDLMIPNLFSPNGDGTNDRFVVQYTGNESFMLEIFDRWGRTVFTSDAVQDAWEGQDSGGGLAREGVYYYSLQIGERMYNGHVTLLR